MEKVVEIYRVRGRTFYRKEPGPRSPSRQIQTPALTPPCALQQINLLRLSIKWVCLHPPDRAVVGLETLWIRCVASSRGPHVMVFSHVGYRNSYTSEAATVENNPALWEPLPGPPDRHHMKSQSMSQSKHQVLGSFTNQLHHALQQESLCSVS